MPKKDEDSIETNVKAEASYLNEISQFDQKAITLSFKQNNNENRMTYHFEEERHFDKYDDDTVKILLSKFQEYIDAKSLPIFERINRDKVEALIDLLLNQHDGYQK